ncbi:MAG: cytidylate kinase-like family protein [Chloroflexota bacterium]|nr:cytidylate kinase-like family protein [Chloroflexota bacterium]|tara:strand:+ start:245 stop:952 length:708 start_codon:yes stop_codon:yes gene_type:complete
MPTIAFEGRHCSGQRDPGRLVAKELGFDFVDRIMLAEIAKKVGSTVEAVSMRKLKKPSIIDMFAKGINQILNSSPTVGVGGDPYFGPGIENAMSKEFYELDETIIKNPEDLDYKRMIEATKEVIKDISDLGKVLVISRGASAILKDKENVLRVFFSANEDERISRAKKMHNLESDAEAIDLLKHADHAQDEYFKKAFNLDFNDQSMYHLTLNTSNLTPEECSSIILNLSKDKLTY